MDIFDALRVVTRWWFVSLPLLVLTWGAALGATASIDPEFTANASILLIGPSIAGNADEGPVNPLLNQPGALTTTAQVAALSANTAQVVDLLASEMLSTRYAAAAEPGAPILLIEARARTRALANATAVRLIEIIEDDLDFRQDAAGAPADQRVTTALINLDAVGGADYGGRTRARVALAIFGLGLSFGAAFLLEGLSRNRREKQAPDAEDPAQDLTETVAPDRPTSTKGPSRYRPRRADEPSLSAD